MIRRYKNACICELMPTNLSIYASYFYFKCHIFQICIIFITYMHRFSIVYEYVAIYIYIYIYACISKLEHACALYIN